ncbi:MAG: hypothetical protein KDE00_04665 [Rhodobacteraceae bacterium]|nr:hypothetical protein [Paracoccaceae bacterium]
MNLNQIGNMILKMTMRALIGIGVARGVRYLERRLASGQSPETPERTALKSDARAAAKRARQAAKITRRLGR